jgi:hypothetical protein
MRISTQLAIVIVAGIAGLVAMVVLLVQAGWSVGDISGLVAGLGTAAGTLIVVLRNQARQGEQLDDQDGKLDRIVEQTNGLSDAERQAIAERAAAAVVRQFRG